jgi:hypothetical protein
MADQHVGHPKETEKPINVAGLKEYYYKNGAPQADI